MGLGHQDRSELSYANFLPLADRYARALPGIGRIAIVGHSLGANVAVLRSDALDNKDVIAVGAADPLNVRRPPFDLFKRHTASNPGDDYRESGYKPILRVHQLDEESSDSTRLVERAVRDVKGVADKLTLASLSISRGLTRPLFNQRLEQSVASKPATHFMIGAGEKSLITDESIRDTVARMQADHPNTRLDLVTIAGRGHGWAEDARLFGEFTLRTITGTHFR
jgi:pimeloyl-ACP methyl ester carboxylesterase